MTYLTDKECDEILTPSEGEQLILILKGKCPHNKGWTWYGPGHICTSVVCVGAVSFIKEQHGYS